jgi:AcrR family transcriptional regulator
VSIPAARKSSHVAMKSGRVRQKLRTRRLLLEVAGQLIAARERPTVSEVADAAGVSRRTAYRYFPTARKLHAEAALEKLRPVMQAAIDAAAPGTSVGGIEARVGALVENMQRLALEHEPLLRTMIHETVLATPSDAEPRRGTRRLEWIESAIEPLRERLGSADYRRLVCALALCTGIEALLVLRDICGLSPAELSRVSQWMCRAMVRQSINDRDAAQRKRRGRLKE